MDVPALWIAEAEKTKERRRVFYSCGTRYVPLEALTPWTVYCTTLEGFADIHERVVEEPVIEESKPEEPKPEENVVQAETPAEVPKTEAPQEAPAQEPSTTDAPPKPDVDEDAEENAEEEEEEEAPEVTYKPDAELNRLITLYQGDITKLEVDAIVNAANKSLLGGGGVDGAIHSAAGDDLYYECRTLHGGETGQTKITRGHALPSKFVLHTVGPIGENPPKLISCYSTCLEFVGVPQPHTGEVIRSVAFCGVSTGIYGYPLYNATEIALKTAREWLEIGDNRTKVDRLIFCTFLDKEKRCYDELCTKYFPPCADKEFKDSYLASVEEVKAKIAAEKEIAVQMIAEEKEARRQRKLKEAEEKQAMLLQKQKEEEEAELALALKLSVQETSDEPQSEEHQPEQAEQAPTNPLSASTEVDGAGK